MTTLYEQYASQRAIIQSEITRSLIKHISFEIYEKTPQERVELANAKISHKKSLNRL